MSVCGCTWRYRSPQKLETDTGSFVVGVTGNCELSNVGSGNSGLL